MSAKGFSRSEGAALWPSADTGQPPGPSGRLRAPEDDFYLPIVLRSRWRLVSACGSQGVDARRSADYQQARSGGSCVRALRWSHLDTQLYARATGPCPQVYGRVGGSIVTLVLSLVHDDTTFADRPFLPNDDADAAPPVVDAKLTPLPHAIRLKYSPRSSATTSAFALPAKDIALSAAPP